MKYLTDKLLSWFIIGGTLAGSFAGNEAFNQSNNFKDLSYQLSQENNQENIEKLMEETWDTRLDYIQNGILYGAGFGIILTISGYAIESLIKKDKFSKN